MRFAPEDHLITHAGCMDGSGCAIVFQYCGGNEENIHYSSPSHSKMDKLALDLRDKHKKGRLILADISVSAEAAEKLHNRNVVICDHHKSALPLADKYEWANINKDNSQCGTMMFLRWCLVNLENQSVCDLFQLAHVIDDRDRWVNKDPRSEKLSELFTALGQNLFVTRFLLDHRVEMTPQETFMIRCEKERKREYIERLTSKVVVKELNGHRVGFVNCDQRYVSEGGHHLCDTMDLQACFLLNADTISLRAPEHTKLDMSSIAKAYGGGGHRCAAGFQLQAVLGLELPEMVFQEMINDPGKCSSGQHI